MHIVDDILQQHFSECQLLISELHGIDNVESLISHKFKVERLVECVAVLKTLSENKDRFLDAGTEEFSSIEEVQDKEDESVGLADDKTSYELPTESRFEFAHSQEVSSEESTDVNSHLVTNNEDVTVAETTLEAAIPSEWDRDSLDAPELAAQEENFAIKEESPALEAALADGDDATQEHQTTDAHLEAPQEKKLKLAHIKALKSVPSLFDPLQATEEASVADSSPEGNTHEVEVPNKVQRSAFKLDLNDRIAFTKILFDGSQSSLNEAVSKLNTFQTLEEAKEYLSELYYELDWGKSDEYAQRLWSLVENKFY